MIFPCHFPACEDGQFFSPVRIYRPRFSHKNNDLVISWDVEVLKLFTTKSHWQKKLINDLNFQFLLTSKKIVSGLKNNYGPRDTSNGVINQHLLSSVTLVDILTSYESRVNSRGSLPLPQALFFWFTLIRW